MKICGLILVIIVILGIMKFWKRKVFIFLVLTGSACFVLSALKEASEQNGTISSIEKNENGSGSLQKELTAVTEDGRRIDMSITVPEKGYSRAGAEAVLKAEASELDKKILGENDSFENIRYDMKLPVYGSVPEVSIKWQSSDPLVISSGGEIQSGVNEEGREIELTAVLMLQDEEYEYHKKIKVYPSAEKETLEAEILKEIERRSTQDTTDELILPETVGGERLIWYEKPQNTIAFTAFLLLAAGILLRINERQKAEEKCRKREERLKAEYPEFISRLLLMLYSGSGVRTAFFRLAALYNREKKNRYSEVFEEVTAACREMDSGSTEDEAYEKMAERCRIPCYRKLSVLLIQNRKRGGKGFTDELEQEVMVSFSEKKRRAEISGNAASLKLLIPLGMMLAVVLALMLIPAFMSV